MCGIIAYVGEKPAYPIIMNGLKRLEYRGYDSAGISLLIDNKLWISKSEGKVEKLENKHNKNFEKSTIGLGHTRWATHGSPNKKNAHPHTSSDGKLAIIHNGIICLRNRSICYLILLLRVLQITINIIYLIVFRVLNTIQIVIMNQF